MLQQVFVSLWSTNQSSLVEASAAAAAAAAAVAAAAVEYHVSGREGAVRRGSLFLTAPN